MRGFLVAYRWELRLIVFIPAISGIAQTFAGPLYGLLVNNSAVIHFMYLVGSVVGLLLLALSYPRVRDLGRGFLVTVWGYEIAHSVVIATSQGVLFIVEVVFPTEGGLALFLRNSSVLALAGILETLVLLWFARQASRLSLMHAVFLLVYSSLNLVGTVTGSTVSASNSNILLYLAYLLSRGAITLTVMLVKVWLLGNFERRDPKFRKNAVFGLLATLILGAYTRAAIAHLIGYVEGPYLAVLPWLDLVIGLAAFAVTTVFELATLVVLFSFVYLVRVRPPKAVAEPELEAPTASPGEER